MGEIMAQWVFRKEHFQIEVEQQDEMYSIEIAWKGEIENKRIPTQPHRIDVLILLCINILFRSLRMCNVIS